MRSALRVKFPDHQGKYREFSSFGASRSHLTAEKALSSLGFLTKFPTQRNRELFWRNREFSRRNRELDSKTREIRSQCRVCRRDPQTALRMRLRELPASRVRFGYRRLTVLLRREGWKVNAKRIYRLYIATAFIMPDVIVGQKFPVLRQREIMTVTSGVSGR